ncbi:histidinol phosphate phosphatase [Desemzia sp. RIT804]|uniref:PHP domain-containing protein n=1 Tax=Desemzia sp. RIT 804 TaxID=2810209 RepID=UPI001951D419|nr:PHP domain-containing protein [Desemzia sp. RIT 804]MBM6615886.1 histidinol phosphate phosphatase [Desemzia sp. RIT 804]
MHYYDQHMHTYFSPDSTETLERYLEQSAGKTVITTEHLDFFSKEQETADVLPDFDAYSEKIAQLNQLYDQRILKGIEVGFTYPDKEKIQDFLSGKDYDLILMSIHHNGRHGFMLLGNDDVPLENQLEEYYSLMLQGVREFTNANVLAHFDYGLRSYEVSVEELKAAEPKLLQIFETAVQHDIAFELNTRSMYRFGNAHLYEYAIDLYRSVGGTLFTVSSDAHVVEDYELGFKDAFEMLKKHGVEQLAVFKNQQPSFVELPQSANVQ